MHECKALSILLSSDYTIAERPGGRMMQLVTAMSEVDGEGPPVRLDYQGTRVVIWGQKDQSEEPEPLWYVTKDAAR